ncbi:MAG: phosphatidylserine decarboxylase family protein [Alistipes sp.]|nr:phosphatidylserine decarboxylase family protein [Alistipes sp.]MBR5585250.1 phosphatidylserine decarboxylase family protein [Alistipes sp.]MBR6543796.1 phosphatidylserine decarboxylase family protein [Alistipes sp.]
MKINKEGYIIIGVTGLICLAIWMLVYYCIDTRSVYLWFMAGFLLIFWFFVAAFFREPRRVQIHDDELIFSPCDGRVVVTEVVKADEYLEGEMLQVSIFMSVTNVHCNWTPVAGEVEYFKHHHGRFLVAWHPKSSTENERTTTVVRLKSGCKVLIRQIAGFVARRIVNYVRPGDVVEQNSALGFIKFGSRVDLLIPKDAELFVEIGDPVIGSQTPIARLKRNS